uniref:Uncharacterized protein n=1 Tax=Solanum tuberosum TaxID=4113 RepID=M1DFW6_SOLTU
MSTTLTKRNEKARKERGNEGLRITESTCVLSPEGKDQVGGKREHSMHRREVPRSSTMSPNDLDHDDVECWCKTVMNYTKGESPS